MVEGTNTPLQLTEVHMAVFDVDGDSTAGLESLSSKGYAGYITELKTSMIPTRLPDGRTQFVADGLNTNIPNPADPKALTPEQRKACVMYFYKNVQSFELQYTIDGTGAWTRNLFFYFDSPLSQK